MLTCKRPFIEIEPASMPKLYGKKILVNVLEDQPLKWDYISD
jgi:sialic acid synthase SpsE